MPSSYATVADFETYMGPGWTTDDPESLEGVIMKAEADIDDYIGILPPVPGRLYQDLTSLADTQVYALMQATCAQTEYRIAMGEPFFTGVTFGQVGPDVDLKKMPPRVSQFAKRVLARAALVSFTGRLH